MRDDWKGGVVVSLLGKQGSENPGNYRVITLLNIAYKVPTTLI